MTTGDTKVIDDVATLVTYKLRASRINTRIFSFYPIFPRMAVYAVFQFGNQIVRDKSIVFQKHAQLPE